MWLRIALVSSLLSSVAVAAPDDRPRASQTARSSSPEGDVSTIVGGTAVPEGKWRDVVAVIGRHATCTGTLIAPDIVLTAGHCIEAEPYEVRTDTVDLAKGGDRIGVKWARAYPNWEHRYDIGILMLDHVARGRWRKIAPACVARRQLIEGAMLQVVGFGLTGAHTERNTELREVELPVIDPRCTTDASCQPAIAPHGEFMAGGGGVDSCFGDSGGPAFITTVEGPALIGVVSRGRALPGASCGDGGVYVRADKVVSWIQRVTGVDLEPIACDGPADDGGDEEPELGGCATGGGAGAGIALLVLVLAIVRRRARG
jgi:uncharacterized protein (TIGR03382 family)